jgi:hypothetical protein
MKIHLVPQIPGGGVVNDPLVILTPEQAALIPHVGDNIVVNGKPHKIKARIFHFHAENTRVHFELE